LAVARALGLFRRDEPGPSVGKFLAVPTRGKLACKRVLFIGVPALGDFGYREIREFSKNALTILASQNWENKSIAMTMHGVGYGLDEREAFSAKLLA